MAVAVMSCSLFPDLSLPFSDLGITANVTCFTFVSALTFRHKVSSSPDATLLTPSSRSFRLNSDH